MAETPRNSLRLGRLAWAAGAVLLGVAIGAAAFYLLWPRKETFYTNGTRTWAARPELGVRSVLWDAGDPVQGLADLGEDYDPCLSRDGQELYFTRGRAGGEADLYVAYRTDDGWAEPAPLAALNSGADEIGPALGDGGSTLYFFSNRDGGEGGYDLYVSRHEGDHWTAPVNLGPRVNTPFNEYDPSVTPDGSTLLFSSNRPSPENQRLRETAWRATLREELPRHDYDVYALDLQDEAAPPVFLETVNSAYHDGQPAVSPDGVWLYFASDRPGGAGRYDLYRARIGSPPLAGLFPPESLGAPVNTAANELDPAVSLEGFGLYFSSDRAEADVYTIYYARSHEVFRVERARRLALGHVLERLSWPLVGLVLALLGMALALLAMTKLKRRPGLMASSLMVSLLLHLVALSLFSVWQLSLRIAELQEDEARFEVAVEVPGITEAELSAELRTALSDLERTDTAQFASEKRDTLTAPPEPAVAEPAVALAAAEPMPDRIEILQPETPPHELMETLEAAPEAPPEVAIPEVVPEVAAKPVRVAEQPDRALPPRPLSLARRDVPLPETPVRPVPRPRDQVPPVEPVVRPVRAPEPPPPDVRPALELETPEPAAVAAVTEVEIEPAPAEVEARPVVAAAEPARREPTARPLASARAVLPDLAPTMPVAAPETAAPAAARTPEATLVAPATPATAPAPLTAVALADVPRTGSPALAAPDTFDPAPAAAPEVAKTTVAAPSGAPSREPPARVLADVPRAVGPVALAEGPAVRAPVPGAEAFGRAAVGPTLVQATAVQPAPARARRLADALRDPVAAQAAPTAAVPEAAVPVEAPVRPVRAAVTAPATAARAELRTARAAAVTAPDAPPEPRRAPLEAPTGLPGAETLIPSAAPTGDALATPEVGDALAVAMLPVAPPGEADLIAPPEPLPLKQLYRLRTQPNRDKAIEELGGSPETEEAVRQALGWLVRHQSDDGRWDINDFMKNHENKGKRADGGGNRKDQDIGVSGLATLAFLGAGHTHVPAKDTGELSPHAKTVQKALDWIIEGQKENGDLRRGGQMYGQAMATMALAEAYTMTGDTRLVEPVRKAVGFIVEAQDPGSGWRYDPGRDSDTSVVGWIIMALKSAEVAGFEIPPKAYRGAANWLDKVRKGKHGGLYEYQPGRKPSSAMTAEGLFVQQYLAYQPSGPRTEESIRYLLDRTPTWNPKSNDNDLYYWYYGTLALHQLGGDAWDAWNRHIQKALVKSQRREGPYLGSWDPRTKWGSHGGRVYATALAALTLEVYYRYLPFYDLDLAPDGSEAAPPGGN